MPMPRPVGLVSLVAMLTLAGCGRGAQAPEVTQAWVRLAPLPGRPAAAYLTVEGGVAPDAVVAIDSPLARRGELHRSMAAGGMMTMQPVVQVPVPAHGTVAFAPGGYHVMLFGVAPQVRPGAPLPLRVRFGSGRTIQAQARVVAPADTAPY